MPHRKGSSSVKAVSDFVGLTKQELSELASAYGLDVPKSMRKSDLVATLEKAKEESKAAQPLKKGPMGSRGRLKANGGTDNLVIQQSQGYWLQVQWELSQVTLDRAQAAMSHHWHQADPTLVLLGFPEGEGSSRSAEVVESFPIPNEVFGWYVQIPEPGRDYQVQLGYSGPDGYLYGVVKSSVLRTTKQVAVSGDQVASELSDEIQRELASLQEGQQAFGLELSAEICVRGKTHPEANVRVDDLPSHVESDGQFSVRVPLEAGRKVVRVEAAHDSQEVITGVAAIDFNLRVLAPRA